MTRRDNSGDMKVAVAFLRLLRGWTQTELAEAAGLSASAISRYESGDIIPTRSALEDLAVAVGLPLRMLDRVLAWLSATRAAVISRANPADPDRLADAALAELTAGLLDLLTSATTAILADLPDLGIGPWRKLAAVPRPEDREEAAELWESLRRREPSMRWVLVEDSTRFQNWALCELLCAESAKAAEDKAFSALELAELALRIAELVPGEGTWRLRLQGYAWAHIGNAMKAANLPGVEEAFTHATTLWAAGAPGDPAGLLDETWVSRYSAPAN